MNTITRLRTYPRIGLVVLAYIAFIALGMPDGLLGVAWPSMRSDFGVPLDAIGALLIAATVGYLTSSALSGTLLARLGVGRVLILSCTLTGLALFGYTLIPSWWMVAVLGIFSGLGAGAIDAGLNTYVAAHFGEGLMQWLHASYGIGVTLGPIIMTLALTRLNSWRTGYHVVSAIQILLAVCFLLTLALWNQTDSPTEGEPVKRLTDYDTSMSETLRQPNVWRSLLMFFLYTGAEVSLGVWTYSLLTESRGVPVQVAGFWTGSYWAMFTLGRMLAGFVTNRLTVNTLVQSSVIGAILGSVLLWWNPFPAASVIAVALIGFAIAPVFPSMVSGTSQRVGEHFAANTIGMQISAAGLGVAAIPSLVGVVAHQFSLEIIPICLLILFSALLLLYKISIRTQSA